MAYTGHTTRHSKEDALSEYEFEQLLDGARNITDERGTDDDYYSLQARFVIFLAGRLGMRLGEITHMTRDWINWNKNMICIPYHEPCIKGRNSMDICGHCKQHARQKAEYNEDVTFEGAADRQWVAKTKAAQRDIPFDFHPRVSMVVSEFFDRYDSWPLSGNAISRRVDMAVEESDLDVNVYPHALRATAASYHAARGLDVIPLQSLMGWAQISTAQNYVRASGENTARALHATHAQ